MTLLEALKYVQDHGFASELDGEPTSSQLSINRVKATEIVVSAVRAVQGIRYMLWGDCMTGEITDADKEWDSETADDVAACLLEVGLGPDEGQE